MRYMNDMISCLIGWVDSPDKSCFQWSLWGGGTTGRERSQYPGPGQCKKKRIIHKYIHTYIHTYIHVEVCIKKQWFTVVAQIVSMYLKCLCLVKYKYYMHVCMVKTEEEEAHVNMYSILCFAHRVCMYMLCWTYTENWTKW